MKRGEFPKMIAVENQNENKCLVVVNFYSCDKL